MNSKYICKSPPLKTSGLCTRMWFTSYLFVEAHMFVSNSLSRLDPIGPGPWGPTDKTFTHQWTTETSESLCMGFSPTVVKFLICFEEHTGHSVSWSNPLLFWTVFLVSGEAVALHRKIIGAVRDSQTCQNSLTCCKSIWTFYSMGCGELLFHLWFLLLDL